MAASARERTRKAALANVSSEECILARISSSSAGGLADQVRVFVDAPVSEARQIKENEGHARAKKLVPFLVRLLKQCGSELRKVPVEGDNAGYERGKELFAAMGIALDALGNCRAWLVGNPIEIELQRYTFLRRLVAWKSFKEAADEGRKILRSLNANLFSANKQGKKNGTANAKLVDELALPLPPPKSSNAFTPDLPVLVAGVVSDLVLCTVECGIRDLKVLQALARLPLQLEPWLSLMNPEEQETHREAIFRMLYKVSSILVSDASSKSEILLTFCTLALDWCLRSSQSDQYLKVARRLCSSIASVDLCGVTLTICETVFVNLRPGKEGSPLANLKALSSDDIRWLISATYNIGVQTFNKKEYDSACRPLKLAHDVAWVRVDALTASSSAPDDQVVSGAVNEACVKTSAFVDCLTRNNDDGAIKVLKNALVSWIRVHSRIPQLQVPQNLLRSWCKITLQLSAEICALHTSFCNLQPALPAASFGLLLEKQMLVLDDIENTGLVDIETMKESMIEFLIDKVYDMDCFAVERSTILIEKSRIARMRGVQNLRSSIALLSETLEEVTKALEKSDAVGEQKLRLEHQRAIAYTLRAHCTQEENPYSQDFLEDTVLAIKSWGELVERMDCWNCLGRQLSYKESVLWYLRTLADLLSLKAMTSLQNEVEILILEVATHGQEAHSKMLAAYILADGRINHVLCPVPVSESVDSILKTKFGKEVDVLLNFAKDVPASLASARQMVVFADFSTHGDATEQYLAELDTLITLSLSSPSNTLRECAVHSACKFYLAELFTQRGDLETAIKYATDSFHLRFKLLNRTFHISKVGNDGQSGLKNKLPTKFEASVASAKFAWPSTFSAKAFRGITQWHILSDYIESLMQVGVLHEKLGSSDEAERNFREGLQLSEAQNIPLASLLFASCLGEVHRKQHLWLKAEEDFHNAANYFEDLDISSVCANCIAMGKSHLELRLGDYARHISKRNDINGVSSSAGKLNDAVLHYQSAVEILHVLPFLKDASINKELHITETSYSEWIRYKWEFHGRRLAAKVFLQQGKASVQLQKFNKAEECYVQVKKILNLNAEQIKASHRDSQVSVNGSAFPFEEAALLYHWSILLLWRQVQCTKSPRDECIPAWMYRAFVLCSTAPLLFKKVCQLLAILHTSDFVAAKNATETRELAAYFHQASVGSMSRQQHLLSLESKMNQQEDSVLQEMRQVLRILPGRIVNLKAEFKYLMHGLPPATVCCISLVERDFSFILEKSDTRRAVAWLLVSRFADGDVTVTILPICCADHSIVEVPEEPDKRWKHRSLLDSDVLVRSIMAELASILQESRKSTSRLLPISTVEEKTSWWKWRTALDQRMASYLRDIENGWFGPWKCLLLGEPSQRSVSEAFRKQAKELCKMLKSKSFLGQLKLLKAPEEALVKLVLQGLSSLDDEQLQEVIVCIFGWRRDENVGEQERLLVERASEAFRCSFASVMNGEDSTKGLRSKTRRTNRKDTLPKSLESGAGDQVLEREPVELVLDGRLQALPWESLPVMRKNEVYRMPSLGSIKAVYLHHKNSLDLFGRLRLDETSPRNVAKTTVSRPAVNPHNAFYLLNPGGDLESTQSAFEEWFRLQKGWEGKTGQVPTIEEYMAALQRHDLFVYLGHGSGDQYFPEKYMQRLETCPASLLMGCSSGRFSARGEYEPVGVPLSYLMAGCPLAIANLWDVTDGDIDRFSRAVLQRWLESSAGSEAVSKPLKSSSAEATAAKAPRRGRSSKQLQQQQEQDADKNDEGDWEEICIGPSIEAGREACKLSYLIGASPVCYGVPTIICRSKKNTRG